MPILSVDQLTAYLKDILDNDPIVRDVWIRGEISNFHKSGAGHCYFSLTDGLANLRCVLFVNNQFGISRLPEQGDAILAHGRVSIYETRGEYQLYVDAIAPEGAGLLQAEFERLRQKLEAEGLFRVERKRTLPELPTRIGVVTSSSGSVWHDIQHVIQRRFPLVELCLAAASVQGSDAPRQLVTALHALWSLDACDVIILARGGGSPEDLACFNDEDLARAIFASPVPIVSAVGHETDISISDLVADVRAPTPSAAAELVVPDRLAIKHSLVQTISGLRSIVYGSVDELRDKLLSRKHRIDRCDLRLQVQSHRQDLDSRHDRVGRLLETCLTQQRRQIERYDDRLALLNPEAILKRGFALVSSPDGSSRVTTAASASRHDRLLLQFADGSVTVRKESD